MVPSPYPGQPGSRVPPLATEPPRCPDVASTVPLPFTNLHTPGPSLSSGPLCPLGRLGPQAHPVKTRQSRVQKRMRTWLNMADCVRRMARWKSFCRRQCWGWCGDPAPGTQQGGGTGEQAAGPHLPPVRTRGSLTSASPQDLCPARARPAAVAPASNFTVQPGLGAGPGRRS